MHFPSIGLRLTSVFGEGFEVDLGSEEDHSPPPPPPQPPRMCIAGPRAAPSHIPRERDQTWRCAVPPSTSHSAGPTTQTCMAGLSSVESPTTTGGFHLPR